MRGLVWTLIWLALVAGAAWYLWRRLRCLWGRTEMLGDTLAEAETLFAAATEREVDPRDGVTDHRPQVELAIFRAPADVAQERDLIRETLRGERAARRRASLPGWARRVDSIDADHRKA